MVGAARRRVNRRRRTGRSGKSTFLRGWAPGFGVHTAFLIGILIATSAAETRAQARGTPETSSPNEDARRLASVSFPGRDWLRADDLLGRSGLEIGTPLVDSDLEGALARLREYEWIAGVGDPETRESPGGIHLDVPVTPRRAIRELRIDTDVPRLAAEIRDELESRPGRPLEDEALARDRERLLARLYDRGFLFAEAKPNVAVLPRGGATVTWVIHEGPVVRLETLRFRGNRAFSDRELTAISGLRPVRLFGLLEDGYYRPGAIGDALEPLRRTYVRSGWLDARVEVKAIEISPDKTDLEVEISIDEGSRYTLSSYELAGESVFPDRLLREVADLETGTPYSADAVEAASRRLLEWYDTRSDLRPRLAIETERGLGKTVSVRFRFEEREAPRVREVRIVGNQVTRDDVIRPRLRIFPGDLYRGRAVEESARALRESGLFRSVEFARVETDDPRVVDLEVTVEELDRYGWFELGGGASSGAGEVAYINIESNNFDLFRWPRSWTDWSGAFTGGGQKLAIQLIPGSVESEYRLLFVEPRLASSRNALTILGASQAYRRESYDETRFGASVELRRFFDIDREWSLAFGWRVENVLVDDIDVDAPADVLSSAGYTFLSYPRLSFRWDAVEVHPLAGPAGERFELAFDVSDDLTGAELDFARGTIRADLFVPLFDRVPEWRHNLRLGFAAGWSRAFDLPDLPITERFFLGGPQDFRGFRYRSLGPNEGGTPLGGQALLGGTVEYDFPLFFQEVRGVALFDWGTLEPRVEDIEIDRFRTAIGAGLRLRFPLPLVRGLVPVNLYWTQALATEPGDEEMLFTFTLGFGR